MTLAASPRPVQSCLFSQMAHKCLQAIMRRGWEWRGTNVLQSESGAQGIALVLEQLYSFIHGIASAHKIAIIPAKRWKAKEQQHCKNAHANKFPRRMRKETQLLMEWLSFAMLSAFSSMGFASMLGSSDAAAVAIATHSPTGLLQRRCNKTHCSRSLREISTLPCCNLQWAYA